MFDDHTRMVLMKLGIQTYPRFSFLLLMLLAGLSLLHSNEPNYKRSRLSWNIIEAR